MNICRYLVVFFLLLSLMGYPDISFSASDSTTPVSTTSDSAAPDLMTPKISKNGRVAMIPFDPDNIDSIKEFMQRIQGRMQNVTIELYTPIGLMPNMVLIGDPSTVKEMCEIITEMFLYTGPKHMIIISATLRQLSEEDVLNLGLKLIPTTISYSASLHVERDQLKHDTTTKQGILDININDGVSTNIFQLDEGISKGTILVASEVFTPNGVKAQISDNSHVPVFSVDFNNNVQTQYQDLETSIDVKPTVVNFSKDNLSESKVRLEIGVKISIVTGDRQMGNITAPTYSDKKFKTTRVFPADGKTYLVGTLVTDSHIQSASGIPFLMKIPLLKYLFSQKTTTKARDYAILSLSVKVIPDYMPSEKLTVPWFHKQGKPVKERNENMELSEEEEKHILQKVSEDEFEPKK